VQLDFNLPERFELEYIGSDGQSHRPVMIHRVVYGALERFLGNLIEHYKGAFPFWLAPVQIVLLPVAETHQDFAQKLLKKWNLNYFIEFWDANLSLGKRIRQAELQKIPFMLIIGDQEVTEKSLTVRKYGDKKQEKMDLKNFEKLIKDLNQF